MRAPAGMRPRMTIVLIASVAPQPMWMASVRVISASPVDVAQYEVERAEDRDDVRDEHAPQQPWEDRDVAERRRADFHAERAGGAPRDHVVAHLAERVLGLHPDLALGHLDDARYLRHDRP